MHQPMRFILGLIVALSLGTGAIAHAGEAIAENPVMDCLEIAAHDRDSEPRDSDADKWGLHGHGGCHGHHQADAVGRDGMTGLLPIRVLNFAAGEDFLPQLVPDANLRPPII